MVKEKCPDCKKELDIDYYLLNVGDSIFCQHCKAEVFVHYLDSILGEIIKCNFELEKP